MTQRNLETFNSSSILAAIQPEALCYLNKLEILDTIDSTNTFLLKQAKAGVPSGTVCLAEHQMQGRGRLGRAWFSAQGQSICCSLLWRFPPHLFISNLGIAIGVMMARVLKKLKVTDIKLKWPNDLYLMGRKLGGILLEAEKQAVVIGIGMNLHAICDENRISLDEKITHFSRNHLTGLLLNELLLSLPLFEKQGLRLFLDEWHEFDFLKGKHITVMFQNEEFLGEAQGINQNGKLILKLNTGEIRMFSYGEASISGLSKLQC